MSIISANPHHDQAVTDEKRLNDAREALFGEKPSRGQAEKNDELTLFSIVSELRKSEIDDIRPVGWSGLDAEERAQMIAERDRKPKSARASALEQVPNVPGPSHRESENIAKRLQRKAAKSDFTLQDMADLEGLAYGKSPKAKLIKEILEGLNRLGLKVDD